ncbi:unnamed protein product, partial [Discosporangium mesarthrocarpum]
MYFAAAEAEAGKPLDETHNGEVSPCMPDKANIPRSFAVKARQGHVHRQETGVGIWSNEPPPSEMTSSVAALGISNRCPASRRPMPASPAQSSARNRRTVWNNNKAGVIVKEGTADEAGTGAGGETGEGVGDRAGTEAEVVAGAGAVLTTGGMGGNADDAEAGNIMTAAGTNTVRDDTRRETAVGVNPEDVNAPAFGVGDQEEASLGKEAFDLLSAEMVHTNMFARCVLDRAGEDSQAGYIPPDQLPATCPWGPLATLGALATIVGAAPASAPAPAPANLVNDSSAGCRSLGAGMESSEELCPQPTTTSGAAVLEAARGSGSCALDGRDNCNASLGPCPDSHQSLQASGISILPSTRDGGITGNGGVWVDHNGPPEDPATGLEAVGGKKRKREEGDQGLELGETGPQRMGQGQGQGQGQGHPASMTAGVVSSKLVTGTLCTTPQQPVARSETPTARLIPPPAPAPLDTHPAPLSSPRKGSSSPGGAGGEGTGTSRVGARSTGQGGGGNETASPPRTGGKG